MKRRRKGRRVCWDCDTTEGPFKYVYPTIHEELDITLGILVCESKCFPIRQAQLIEAGILIPKEV